MSIMKTNMDFIQWLGRDLSIKVFSCLDDSRDLIRASAVCSYWGDLVGYLSFITCPCSARIFLCVSLFV
jgi:hypothetical protein